MYVLVDKQINVCSVLDTTTFTVSKMFDSACEKLVKDLKCSIEGVFLEGGRVVYRPQIGVLPGSLASINSIYKHIILGLQKKSAFLGASEIVLNANTLVDFDLYSALRDSYCFLNLCMHSLSNNRVALTNIGSTRGLSESDYTKIATSNISIDCLLLSGVLPQNITEFVLKLDSGIVLYNVSRNIDSILLIFR